jgi:proteic killer suppression protein
MIVSFANGALRRSAMIGRHMASRAIWENCAPETAYVAGATRLEDWRVPPANRPGALTGDRSGPHGIRINDQWQLCFVWRDGDAFDVAIVDYHMGLPWLFVRRTLQR